MLRGTRSGCSRIVRLFHKCKRKLLCGELLNKPKLRGFSSTTQKCLPVSSEPLKVLFFGTDNFSLPSLEALRRKERQENGLRNNSLGVVTSFKNPANCVREHAEKHKLPLFRWPVPPEVCVQYDLGIVVSFGHLIPEDIIKAFPHGMINVHASLLPRWRGAAPIVYAIMHGDRTTGVSIMKIAPRRFDVGDILGQQEVEIKPNILMPELHTQLAHVGAGLLLKVLSEFPQSFENALPQRENDVTLAPKITPALTEVDWTATSAQQLHRRFRALYGFKHLSTVFLGKQVQLLEVIPHLCSRPGGASIPGHFRYQREQKCLVVCCADGTHVEVHKLRLEGKKPMTAMEFNNGFLQKAGTSQLLFETPCNKSADR